MNKQQHNWVVKLVFSKQNHKAEGENGSHQKNINYFTTRENYSACDFEK